MKHFKLPFHGDESCMKIWDADMNMVADIRSWGYLTGGLGLSEGQAIQAQSDLMKFIVTACNRLNDVYDAGFSASAEGWNAEYPGGWENDEYYKDTRAKKLEELFP